MAFRYYLRVRYQECDAQKVVFNSRYADYVDLAVGELMRALGFEAEMVSGALDYQLVKQTVEWKAPARYDDVLELSVRCARIGTTSFVLGTEFRRDGSADLLATSETVYVCVDGQLRKKPVPERLRASLERGSDAVADHSGRAATTLDRPRLLGQPLAPPASTRQG